MQSTLKRVHSVSHSLDQVAVLLDFVHNRIASDPELLEKLKNMMNPPIESQEEEIQS